MVNKANKYVSFVLQAAIAIMLFGLVAINVLQVFTRYFFDIIVLWIEDVSILTLSWMVACGIPWLWMKKDHIFMDVIDIVVPKKIVGYLKWLVEIAGIIGGVSLIFTGIRTVSVNSGYIYSIIRYDEGIRYYPLVFTGVLLTFAATLNTIEIIQSLKSSKVVRRID